MEAPREQSSQVGEWQAGDNEYSQLRYVSPREQDPEDFPQHKFELTENGAVIAGAELDYYSRPLPLYQLSELWSENPGQGNASKVMTKVEAFLQERRKPGVLTESIMGDDQAQGMYQRRGWVPVPDEPGLHVYNWPQDVPLDVLQGYPLRYTPLQDREAWQDKFDQR